MKNYASLLLLVAMNLEAQTEGPADARRRAVALNETVATAGKPVAGDVDAKR